MAFNNNSFKILKARLLIVLSWQSTKSMLLPIAIISLVLSIFDFVPDIKLWLIEILRNIVIVGCITLLDNMFFILSGIDWENKNIRTFLTVGFIFLVGGVLGGYSGWAINAWLFGFNVTSVLRYTILVAGFSLIFGIATFSFSSLQQQLRKIAHKLAEKEINEQRLLQLKIRAELEALRAKINPHFLFNTINSISGLIHEDPDKADEILQKLSHLFRYTLAASNQEFTKLEEEMLIIEEYLEIEKIRLQDRLTYQIEMDENLSALMIPGMLLQPLVENSVKHGIATNKDGGHIEIRCQQMKRKCEIEIVDTGKGFNKSSDGNGFGLRSVKDRLTLYYGQEYELKIFQKNGTHIKIVLPKESLKVKYLDLKKDHE